MAIRAYISEEPVYRYDADGNEVEYLVGGEVSWDEFGSLSFDLEEVEPEVPKSLYQELTKLVLESAPYRFNGWRDLGLQQERDQAESWAMDDAKSRYQEDW